ncbi:MAG: bacterial Ig-like domain-containing protein, partial [Clostridia bacterium]|nr:bacterial Ig-like domain-containing protein [Clostridia bacterium]
NWHQDDWGNWGGTNRDKYTPVEGTLVTQPISFYLNEKAEVCVKSEGLQIVEGYKDTYFVGDRIDMTTLLIRMSQGGEPMHILEEMVSYDFSKAGTATVTVTVKDMTATYTVKVVENPNTEAPTEAPTEPPTEAPTEPPTEALTETPTDPVTEAPAVETTASETTAEIVGCPPEKKGCGATVMTLSVVILIAASAVSLKKKED